MPRFSSILINCQICQRQKWVQPYLIRNGYGKYCSCSCAGKAKVLVGLVYQKGHTVSLETREKLRKANIGLKHPSNNGPNHHWWKGGVSKVNDSERKQIMDTPEYRLWRYSVFERDNWSCVLCGYRGKNLNADHIYSFSLFEELRFEISNGRTLCQPCHRKTENYGYNKRYEDRYFIPTVIKLIQSFAT